MSARVLTDAEILAVDIGWQLAHDEICRLRQLCSAHQPIGARPAAVVEALLSDWRFMAVKDRADWPSAHVEGECQPNERGAAT